MEVRFEFYYNEYNRGQKGLLDGEMFPYNQVKAWRELEPLLTSVPQTDEDIRLVKLTICEIADEIFNLEARCGLKSEAADGYSATFAEDYTLRRRVLDIAIRRLWRTGLLYMGVE